jgi:hypothetical protein
LSAAVLAGALGQARSPRPDEAASSVATDVARAPLRPSDRNGPPLEPRVAELERRLHELAAADAGAPPHPVLPPEAERQAKAERNFEEHRRLVARHDAEPRDGSWAAKQERAVGTTLGALSETMKRSFSLESVDCRNSTCVARLAWPNEIAARSDLQSLLGGSAAVGCAREVSFPPAERAGEYEASLYFDCAEARWGGPK